MIAMTYKTIKKPASDEIVEKRSRFIGYAKPVKTQEEATEFINEIRSKHFDARHNVYAYVIREGGVTRYSDDAEPQGTAGMPVLDCIRKRGITDCVVVVTRYFGGILLGAGGLVRAYSAAAKLALDAAGECEMALCSVCELSCSYTLYGKLPSLIANYDGAIDEQDFSDDVKLRFHLPAENLDRFSEDLREVSLGKIRATENNQSFFEK